jgi:hypothetical protein
MRKYNIPSDFIQTKALQPIVYKQYDNGDKLVYEPYDDGEKINLTDEIVLAFFELVDGTVIEKTCEIINGNAVATLDNNILSKSGKLTVEFTIYKDGSETSTRAIIISVEKSINRNEAIETIPKWDIVQQILDLKASDGSAIEGKINVLNEAVEVKFNELAAAAQVNSEVVLARGGEATLGQRLDKVLSSLADMTTNVKSFGAKSDWDGTTGTDNVDFFNAAFANGYKAIIPKGTYRISQFRGIDNQHVDGMGSTLKLYNKNSPVMAVFGSNSIYENIVFESTEAALPWSRATLENLSNVMFRNCTFRGFRDPATYVAWGIYMKNTKNVVLDNCKFSNNSQSDIALLEGTENITIINAMGENGEKVYLNLEPNTGTNPIKSVNVIGGNFDKVDLLENDNLNYSMQNIVFNGSSIDTLVCDGANVEFVNCKIKTILSEASGDTSYMGVVNFRDSLMVGKNLIPDHRIVSLSRDDTSYWSVGGSSISPANMYSRIDDVQIGKALRLNPTAVNAYNSIKLKTHLNGITAGKKYLIALTSRVVYAANAGFHGKHLFIKFYDASDVLLKTIKMYNNRALSGTTTKATTEIGVVIAPSNATKVNFHLGNEENNTTNILDTVSITFHEIIEDSASGNADFIKQLHSLNFGNIVGYAPTQPKDYMYYPNFFVGDKVYVPPVAGGFEGYVCISAGTAGGGASSQGTWKGFGTIAV